MAARVGPPGTSKGPSTTVAPSSRPAPGKRRVTHLDVEDHARSLPGADVAGGPGLGSPSPAGMPMMGPSPPPSCIAAGRIRPAFGIGGDDLPVDHRPRPVSCHVAPLCGTEPAGGLSPLGRRRWARGAGRPGLVDAPHRRRARRLGWRNGPRCGPRPRCARGRRPAPRASGALGLGRLDHERLVDDEREVHRW